MKTRKFRAFFTFAGLMLALSLQAQTTYPEDGWWWDVSAPGRGYFIERQENTIFIAAFIYTDDGTPEWLTSDGQYTGADPETGSIGSYTGNVYRNSNGQCIGCDYQAPIENLSEQSPLTINFSDGQNGELSWFGETIPITRFFWAWNDVIDQLNGTWLLTELEDRQTLGQIITIAGNDSGVATMTNAVNGVDVGTVELLGDDLVLLINGASENALPLVLPESKRFYAGFGDADALQAFGVRLDDLPMELVLGNNNGTGTTESTQGVLCEYFDSTPNNQASLTIISISEWSCTETTRVLSANGVPDHEVGTFPNPNNPNTISAQNVSATMTLTPVQTDTVTPRGGPMGVTGYVLNGVKLDANTAGTCNDSGNNCSLAGNVGSWNIEALGQSSFNFGDDQNHAHVQPSGEYHYHGIPEGFVDKQGGNASNVTIIGWAADGFPIYARYGYSDPMDAGSQIRAMEGSYQLVTNVSASRPSTNLYELGTFSQDWEYVEGSGDLDECNGRFGVTPEFPEGIYHYYATDSYPYFQRCVKGQL